MNNLKDMTGFKFNGCEVISRKGSDKNGKALWEVVCFCGNSFITLGSSIRQKRAKSCGCSHKKAAKEMGLNNKTHGATKSRLYLSWKSMKARCFNENHKSYKNYGARGITICNSWSSSFENFEKWAVENGYKPNLTLDRIDVNGNYEPSNCKWATRKEQGRNKTNNFLIEFNGEILTLSEVAERTGKSRHVIKYKIKNNKSIKEADL